MNDRRAIKQYQSVNTQSGIVDANPHQLIATVLYHVYPAPKAASNARTLRAKVSCLEKVLILSVAYKVAWTWNPVVRFHPI